MTANLGPATRLNEKPFSHVSMNGTSFASDRCDFKNGVRIKIPADLSDVCLIQDVADMIQYHALNIWEQLNGFAGYSCIVYEVERLRG